MRQRLSRRSIGVGLAVLTVGLLASGCDWVGFGNGSQHSGDAFEANITPANVSTLAAQFSATDGSTYVTPEAAVSGVLYVDSSVNGIEAYSASGTNACSGSPAVCAPLWSYGGTAGGSNIMVSNGILYVSETSGLEAFDAAGQTNCSGTPVQCQPLWSVSGSFSPPTVANGTVFVTRSGTLEAFDASGTAGCSGTPKRCTPMWTASNVYGTVTVSAGVAYALSDLAVGANGGGIDAFDAKGVQSCSGSPKVCTPLWQYVTNYPVSGSSYAVVSGAELYVATFYSPMPRQFTGDIEGFDASGKAGCKGTPGTCSPILVRPAISISNPLLVGDGSIFAEEPGDMAALNQTSGAPEWSANSDNLLTAQAIGGSVLYVTDGTNVTAYDAGGSAGCSGSPLSCAPLWSVPGVSAIVSNDLVYVSTTNPSGGQEIVAYGLPGAS